MTVGVKYEYGDTVRLPNGGGLGTIIDIFSNKNGVWYTVRSAHNYTHHYPVYQDNLARPEFREGDIVQRGEAERVTECAVVRDNLGTYAYRYCGEWFVFAEEEPYPDGFLEYPLTVVEEVA